MYENTAGRKSNIEFTLALLLMAKLIKFCAEAVINAIGMLPGLMIVIRPIEMCIYLICFVSFILYYFGFSNIERVKKHTLLKTVLVFGGLLLTYYFFSMNNSFITSNFSNLFYQLMVFGFIFYFASTLSVDYQVVFEKLKYGIPVAIIYGLISAVILHTDYMTISNIILMYTLIAYHLFKTTTKKKYAISFIILMLLVVFAGSRGALLWLLVFYVIYNLFLNRGITKKGMLVASFIILIIIFTYIFQDQVFALLVKLFPNSRTIEMLSLSQLSNDSSRSNIWKFFISEIQQHPFRINGLFADRAAINSTFMNTNKLGYWITENRAYSYAHDVFLELIYDFGIIIGGYTSIKLVSNAVNICQYAKKTNDKNEAAFYIIMLVYGFFMLLISDSFLINFYFWFYLGLSNRIPKKHIFRIGTLYL